MHVSIRRLKRIIAEALMSREDIEQRIRTMDANEIATDDYVDVDTGEVYLQRGQPAGKSNLHPDYYGMPPGYYTDEDPDEEEDAADYDTDLDTELDAAIQDYAQNWTSFSAEMPDVEFEDAAPDAAEGFFYEHPDWRKWQSLYSRWEIKERVTGAVHAAMMGEL